MQFKILGQDRFLRKDANQADKTKGADYTVVNPAPKRGDDSLRKIGRPKGSEEDGGAPNVLTGTVITSCFIQTSALPSRIELQGNDLTFFDDTYSQGGHVIGDTSRLIFTHGSGKVGEVVSQGFIIEKRASVYNTYDNVLSLYSPPPKAGAHNYVFIGRNGTGDATTIQRNISSINFAVNSQSDFIQPDNTNAPLNGTFNVEYSLDGTYVTSILYSGTSESMFPGSGLPGFSALLNAGDGGVVGLAYLGSGVLNALIYLTSVSAVTLGASFIPDTANTYNLGSSAFPFKTLFFGSAAVAGRSLTTGIGSPEGVVTAPVGSLYTNQSGGASTTLYVKTSGVGNTGWTAK